MPEQDEIDGLMDSLNEADAAASEELPKADQAPEAEDDGFITSSVLKKEKKAQEKPSGPLPKKDPRGVPWVDFYPEFTHKRPNDLLARMLEQQDNIRQILLIKELQRLRTLEIKIHRSYYWSWVREANAIIRNAVRLRARITAFKAKPAKTKASKQPKTDK